MRIARRRWESRYQQHAAQAALAHRLSKRLATRFQYGYYYNSDEPTLAGANNYKAHTIFATLIYQIAPN